MCASSEIGEFDNGGVGGHHAGVRKRSEMSLDLPNKPHCTDEQEDERSYQSSEPTTDGTPPPQFDRGPPTSLRRWKIHDRDATRMTIVTTKTTSVAIAHGWLLLLGAPPPRMLAA